MPSYGAETHLFSSHPTIEASETSASRAWGPCQPVSPKGYIKASHGTRNRPEKCLGSTMAGRPRALFVTNRHKTSDLTIFASHFRDRVHLKKKVSLGVRLISTRRRVPRFFCHTSAHVPEGKFLVQGGAVGWPLPLGFGLDGRLLLERCGRVCV